MNVSMHYERLAPTTVSGDSIKLSIIYSSFNIDEIDKLEDAFEKGIGTMIVMKGEE